MSPSRNETIAEFTRKVATLNMALRQFLQYKLRQHNIDLTYEMLQVLGCLWKADGINQQEIANITIKDKASMTYLIDNLVKRDLVYRQEDANDRRNKLIFLTPAGRAMRHTVQPLVTELHTTAGDGIDLDVIKSIYGELEKMQQNLAQP